MLSRQDGSLASTTVKSVLAEANISEGIVRKGIQTRRLLLIGFGGLLLLLAFTGFNTISVLNRIQARNQAIRLDYINRDQILESLRSDIYLSGTYVRDFLLEPDTTRAAYHRDEFNSAKRRIDLMIAAYRRVILSEEKQSFEAFEREVAAYFSSLEPTLHWTTEQRKQLGYTFMRDSLLPRRMEIVRLADQIGRLNQKQMNEGNARVVALFTNFRKTLLILLVATLLGGTLLAGASVYRILRLEGLSARHLEEVLETRRALRELSGRLVEVQETERRALSRELHDEVGQALSALLLALGNAAAMMPPADNPEIRSQLLDTRRLAERTVAVVRDMCLFLRPSMLDDLGLLPALEWKAREIARTTPLRVSVQADSPLDEIPDDQKTCIYRIVQEALQNVVRHAKAKSAQIVLTREDDYLDLSIKDDGQGFSPEREKGLGLLGMGERVQRLNGSFAIKSGSGDGTLIIVRLPLVVEKMDKDNGWSL